MEIILDLLFYIFDLFIMIYFYTQFFSEKRTKFNSLLYYVIFIIIDITTLKLQNFLPHPIYGIYTVISTLINIVAYFLLCLLHSGSIKKYIAAIISLELCIFVSDYLSSLIIYKFYLDKNDVPTDIQLCYFSFISEFFLFLIIVLFIKLFIRRK